MLAIHDLVVVLILWNICLMDDFVSAKVHIVYMGSHSIANDPDSTTALHHEMLSSVLATKEEVEDSLLYSYSKSFSGFAADISNETAAALSELPGVVSVFPSRTRRLHTTRSWDFLGFNISTHKSISSAGSDTIIGVLDTGVWPESQSFNDDLVGSIPAKWKGTCVTSDHFNSSNCNRKLIGARFYVKGYEKEYGPVDRTGDFLSVRDVEGHGTHTASTAGGSIVRNASLFGLAQGDARGGAPGARIASYKVCWLLDCSDADILAAFDDAIHDGVDILTISIGADPVSYFEDTMSIGSFHALQSGILTCLSAGNNGPSLQSATNVAPWVLTVAASSIDREFVAEIVVGEDNASFKGRAVNTFKTDDSWKQIILGEDASDHHSSRGHLAKFCANGSLDHTKVKGRIVLCYGGEGDAIDDAILEAGGGGLVYADDYDSKTAFAYCLPAAGVDTNVAASIREYMNSTRSPVAKIKRTVVQIGNNFSPVVATFSSRGPNVITPDILKPDLTAPGVDILAAYSPLASVSGTKDDKRSTSFNILSGTSMSCPHVAGAAAFLRTLHPDWSPSAIKSALMTTATPLDTNYKLNKDGAFAFGSGQINPLKAADPGLVYDSTVTDFALFFCAIGYTRKQIQALVTRANFTCPPKPPSVNELNYPSIAIPLKSRRLNVTVTRTVTNVGPPDSTYRVHVEAPPGLSIRVTPAALHFKGEKEKTKKFRVSLSARSTPRAGFRSGTITWHHGVHTVRSPVVVWRV